MLYMIRTPNEQFNGKREGLTFVSGVAYTDNEALRNCLVCNYGYTSESVESSPEAETPNAEPEKTKTTKARRGKTSGK